MAGSREGIWWQPRAAQNDLLIFSNTSEKTLAGTLWLSDASGKRWSQRVSLAARQTIRLNLHDLIAASGLSGQYGGVQFEVSANAGALGSVHLLYDEPAKSSASLEMFSRLAQPALQPPASPAAKQLTVYAPMLALRTPDPAVGLPSGTVLQPTILVRNTTAKQVPVNITLSWRRDSARGQVNLPPLELAPFATQQLQIGAMQKQLGIPDDAHWALVTLTTPGSPNDLVAIAASYDASGKYNLETPFTSNVAGHFAGGEWRADSTHNQIMAVTNTGQKPTNALITLHYDNGEKSYEMQQTIQPGDQMWLNVASLIHNRVPDRKGNVLPADASFGTYDLRDLSPGLGSLMQGSLTLDNTFGFSAKPPYPACCPNLAPAWEVDEFEVLVNGYYGDPIEATDACTGLSVNISNLFNDWSSGNPGIATVTNTAVTGVTPGTTTANASGWVLEDGCVTVPVNLTNPVKVENAPSGEITEFVGTILITQGQFLMTLEPSTTSYDNHSVTESSPVLGTNACWWSTSGMVQYPVVQGDTWVVDQGGSAEHNQYGKDTIGFESGVVNLIQTQGAAHGVEFPCAINIHQSMNYDGIDLYVTNLLTQTVGSSTVTVCRAGVCSSTIPF